VYVGVVAKLAEGTPPHRTVLALNVRGAARGTQQNCLLVATARDLACQMNLFE